MKLSLVDLPKREVRPAKKNSLPYITNGENDDYPTQVEGLVNASATAKSCAGVVADFISGQGFLFEKTLREEARQSGQRFDKSALYINPKKETPNALLKKVARSLAYQRGVFLHINYNALFQKTSVQVLPYKYCRLGASDSNEYRGKILYWNNWDGASFEKKDVQVFDTYNPDPQIIQAQVEASGGWQNYKGQILFLNLDRNDTYPLAYADTCLLDCESEMQSAIFSRNSFRKGFFGQYIAFTSPFESKSQKEAFSETLQAGVGVDSEQSIMLVETQFSEDALNKTFQLEKIESNINDKLFSYTDQKVANNIRKAYSNVPTVLIDYVEGKMGNTSGESLLQAQRFMQAQTQDERSEVEELFEEVFSNFHKPISSLFEIVPLIQQ